MEELDDGSRKSLSKMVLTSRGHQLILVDSRDRQLILPASNEDQLMVECAASHPQLGEDQLTFTHILHVLSKSAIWH